MVNARAKDREGAPVSLGMFSWVQPAIGVGMVASARFGWLYSQTQPGSPPPAVALFLFELPLMFCVIPFFTGESSKRSVRSAGMVFGTALSFCPILFPMEVDTALRTMGGGGGYLAQLVSFLPMCLITALCMLGVSWLCGKGHRAEFIASAKRGILGFLFVSLLVVLASLGFRLPL
jgi:hypothetical protein